MATEISKIVLKRGTTAKAVAYTGPVGEVVVDTDLRTLRVQDNVTPGGVLLSKEGHAHAVADVSGLQTALDAKAPLVSPALSGTPTAPTATAGTNTTQLATTAFVASALAAGVGTATKLQTARTIALAGDVTGSASFDGSANVTITAVVADDSHQHTFANLLGLPTTIAGYGITDAQPLDSDLTAVAALSGVGIMTRTGGGTAALRSLAVSGTGLSINNADGLTANPTIAINATDLNTAGTVVARDVSGNFSAGTITAALSGNASTATKLQTSRTIGLSGDASGTAAFDGSANATIAVTLGNSGVSAGTYKSVTVDSKGRVTSGTNPTTLSGYGITDAQPLDADLTAIASLVGASGILKKTALDTWTLDTSAYLTGNQSITVSGDASGSGTTAISLTLANSGVSAGTYKSVTVDAKGRVTAGTNPTTLSGYGITDAALATHNHTVDGLSNVTIATKASGDTLTWNGTAWVNTAQSALVAGNATKLSTGRTIALTGDVSYTSGAFDGSANVTGTATLAASGVTAGSYGSATQVGTFTVDSKGRLTAAANVTVTPAFASITGKPTTLSGYGITDAVSSSLLGAASGVATLDATGKIPSIQLPSYVDDVLEYANLASFPVTGTSGIIYVTLDTNKVYRWSGTAYIEISAAPGSTDAVVEGTTNLYFTVARAQAAVTTITGNAGTATKLQTARTVSLTGDATGSVSFDGSANVSISTTLANSGVTAGTYPKVTVDAKGRVTAGAALAATDIPSLDWSKITTGKPTTLAGYGITDALGASTYTAADVLAKLLTVDGVGSGLDADTLDGMSSTQFIYKTAGGLLAPVATGDLVLDCRDGAI
jgi:phage-related tail fiber protein